MKNRLNALVMMLIAMSLLIIAPSTPASAVFNQYPISLVAGNGTYGPSGDGGPAVSAQFNELNDTKFSPAGELYIVDAANNRIRKVNSSGIVSTVVGTGAWGNGNAAGDGGPATNAELSYPSGIAFDTQGNLYIADTFDFRIRKVDLSGTISTIAGTGATGYSGDGGQAITATFGQVFSLVVDAQGNIYVGDATQFVVRKIAPNGIISTIAGSNIQGNSGDGGLATSARFNNISSMLLDSRNQLYISDYGANVVRKIDAAGIITSVAGTGTAAYSGDGGLATSAEFSGPGIISMDSLGQLYIPDYGNCVLRRVDTSGIVSTIVGGGSCGNSGNGGSALAAGIIPGRLRFPERRGSLRRRLRLGNGS